LEEKSYPVDQNMCGNNTDKSVLKSWWRGFNGSGKFGFVLRQFTVPRP